MRRCAHTLRVQLLDHEGKVECIHKDIASYAVKCIIATVF